MKRCVQGFVAVALGCALGITASFADERIPEWAYVVNPPSLKPAPDDGIPRSVPGSDRRFTLTQIRDVAHAPDWHPGDHPAMPSPVAQGPRPGVLACGYCHLPNGLGRPENSSLAGLPVDYIVRQVAEFRSGTRRSSEPRSLPVNFMVSTAKGALDDEVRAAAEYFSALPLTPWIRVVESGTVPVPVITGWMLAPADPPATEPIGRRIVEMPEDLERTELRDARSGFVAYVPPGSVERGRALAAGQSKGLTACSVCHGAGLRGLGPVPGIAGRSPSYVVRQLHDMRNGTRDGLWVTLMKPVVSVLTPDDILDLAAYTASLAP